MIGSLLKWCINIWVATTGKTCKYEDYPWLRGPLGNGDEIGDLYYKKFADEEGLTVSTNENAGLMENFSILFDEQQQKQMLKSISRFYEQTISYKLEVWSQWYKPMSLFAKIVIKTLSAKMNQLNIPLYPLETSRGMSNEVIHLSDESGIQYACWLRKTILSNKVVYAGFYSAVEIGGQRYVRVIFPLPDGNVTVLLRPEVNEDGSVLLLSNNKEFGREGYYRVRRKDEYMVKVRKVPIAESIHVFEDEEGVLRTDHLFWFMKSKLLHLHYKIMKK